MQYWNPATNQIKSWMPKSGWNKSFSEADKIKCTNLYHFFYDKKHYTSHHSEIMAQMVIYKDKYHGLSYSEEQEAQLKEALKSVFNC